ncbi:MAG: 1-acyl-sn-glycerol-3-phosphate acyltransferase, partial [Myxococcales bacterium]|nr:1-acyl-sn-glycerol-3-phosphate acyltransferase [Myxococcales bacterium]
MTFAPIAIVGHACVLPGVLDPNELIEAVLAGRDLLSPVPRGRWELAPERALVQAGGSTADRAYSDRGGYVAGFEQRFDPSGFALSPAELRGLDPLYLWVLHTAREALRGARVDGEAQARTGAIFGNLSFPSDSLSRYAEQQHFPELTAAIGRAPVDPRNRFMSGLPAHVLANALGLGADCFALDAACASSLYAIKLACDALHDRRADRMLAGAVNRADDLFIHVGFTALGAQSPTGRSRPFHAQADGLVPGEGAAFVVLERLDDALANGRTILGVIRGAGLSNDGRGRGMLAPSAEGQVRAMQTAYAGAGIDPRAVQYVECHATGTKVGDATEIASMSEVFRGAQRVGIGSLKANTGHLITVAGVAGVIKVVEAMRRAELPPTPHVDEPHPALAGTPFHVLGRREPWHAEGARLAGVSAFGFGGNNAHVIVQEFRAADAPALLAACSRGTSAEPASLALVALGARVGDGASAADLARDVATSGPRAPRAEQVRIGLTGLRTPPRDLEATLAQQTLLLAAAREAWAHLEAHVSDATRVGVLIGCQCDAEVARYGARWRLAEWGAALGWPETRTRAAQDSVTPVLEAAGVLGTMPNIPANRLSGQLDARGPGFAISAEELSGVRALEVGGRMLRAGELDLALVGAVDLSCEPVHEAALAAVTGETRTSGDAAVVCALMREADARAAGLPILALLDTHAASAVDDAAPAQPAAALFGHAHAAAGLLDVVVAALRAHASGTPQALRLQALLGASARVQVRPGDSRDVTAALLAAPPSAGPQLTLPAHLPSIPRLLPDTAVPARAKDPAMQTMPKAPSLPSVTDTAPPLLMVAAPAPQPPPAAHAPAPALGAAPVHAPTPAVAAPTFATPTFAAPTPAAPAPSGQFALFAAAPQSVAAIHQQFVAQQAQLHQQFLALRQHALVGLVQAGFAPGAQQGALPVAAPQPSSAWAAPVAPAPASVVATGSAHAAHAAPYVASAGPASTSPASVGSASVGSASASSVAGSAAASHAPLATTPSRSAAPSVAGAPSTAPAATSAARPAPAVGPASATRPSAPHAASVGGSAATAPQPTASAPAAARSQLRTPTGPSFDRQALEVHAGGRISEIFGPLFAQQDPHSVQVRMPEPPLLLADRVTGIDAEPGTMKKGTVWTETDVREDSWWLNQGYMPAGIMIESGQADLFLISYLGVDFLNRGERAYRLLGCELTYHGSLPKPGETLVYEIDVDGHANQGDVRLFFFHYDCVLRDAQGHERPALSVRQGQAGFFTTQELADSAGILWKPQDQKIVPADQARVDAPEVPSAARSFSAEQVRAFSEGNAYACFGAGYERLLTHNRTPKIQAGDMLFLDEVTDFDPQGGPWKRGYLRATQAISSTDWFFDGHFKNDPCMPGTLMFEGCLQMMGFYLAAMGYTVDRDGWRFEPVPEEAYKLLCRGQVLPTSKNLVYEIFVEEVHDGPVPTLYADLLCTIDGLGAFHARRMGLRLVPDWPITSMPELLRGYVEAKPVASANGFQFDYASLLACAWGKPSDAFGEMYRPFDGTRRVARLPGPPYHFMTRVTRVDGDIGVVKAGAVIEIEYDFPDAEWYFRENGAATMPFCVFLEAALQPCGWLASFVGSALTTEEDLLFRNLDGKATIKAEVLPGSGTFRTVVKITNISQSAGMIIESFSVRCFIGDVECYELETVFGFFPKAAFVNQVGLPITPEHRALLDAPSNIAVDFTADRSRCGSGSLRLANPMLLMLDRVTHYDPKGGKAGLGTLRAEKDVDPDEWFFKAHFFQDPVQPGSLGIEAMLQLLQFHMLEQDMGQGVQNPRFEPIAIGHQHSWKYRGQVVPTNKVIGSTMEITEVGTDPDGAPFAIAKASLWVDGKRIYEAPSIGMRIVPSGSTQPDQPTPPKAPNPEETLDPKALSWLGDHQPTFTVPALPMMSMVDRLLGASGSTALVDVQVHRWLPTPAEAPPRVRVEREGDRVRLTTYREARDARLSRFEPVASGRIPPATEATPTPPTLDALVDARREPDPYADGTLFHGPAFHYVTSWELGANGSTTWLDAARGSVPPGVTHQGLLDALTHGIPHDAMHRWHPQVSQELVAYPYGLEHFCLHAALPGAGHVRVEARALPFAADDSAQRFPRTRVLAFDEAGMLLVDMLLREILLPKGPLGSADGPTRRLFLRDRAYAGGLGLSASADGVTRCRDEDVRGSDWLPGTVASVYALTSGQGAREVAIKDHVARLAEDHPSRVIIEVGATSDPSTGLGRAARKPITGYPFRVSAEQGATVVQSTGAPQLDCSAVRAFWRGWFGLSDWPVEHLYFALLERFVSEVTVESPEAHAALHGRPVLYLANHQTGIESLLFSILAGALQGVPSLTLAKVEHRDSWLGRLIAHCFTYPGARDPGVIAHFQRDDPASLPRIVAGLRDGIAGERKSLMVHVEGTRALLARQPVATMSGVFIDLALTANVHVVPVRFAHGLPIEPLAERLEYPVGMGRQAYHLGAPIAPDELRALTYKARSERVLEAINRLGPPLEREQPSRPEPLHGPEREGVAPPFAVLMNAVAERAPANSTLRAVCASSDYAGALAAARPAGPWMAELAALL